MRLLKCSLILLIGFVLLIIVTPKLLDPNQYKSKILSNIHEKWGISIELGDLDWQVLHGIQIRTSSLKIERSPTLPVDFSCGPVKLSVALIPLLKKQIVIHTFSIDQPIIKIYKAKNQSEDSKAPALSFVPMQIEIKNGALNNANLCIVDTMSKPILSTAFSTIFSYKKDIERVQYIKGQAIFKDLNHAKFYPDGILGESDVAISYDADIKTDVIHVDLFKLKTKHTHISTGFSIKNWKTAPVWTNNRLSAELYLPDLAPLMPKGFWKAVPEMYKDVFSENAKIFIHQANIPELIFSGKASLKKNLKSAKIDAIIENLALPVPDTLPPIQCSSGIIQYRDNTILFEKFNLRTPLTSLPLLSGKITDLWQDPGLLATLTGTLNIPERPTKEGRHFLDQLKLEDCFGNIEMDLEIKGPLLRPDKIKLNGNARLSEFRITSPQIPVQFDKVQANIKIKPSHIHITNGKSAVLPRAPNSGAKQFVFNFNATLNHWSMDPLLSFSASTTAPINLQTISKITPLPPYLSKKGIVKINELTVSDISLKRNPGTIQEWLSKAKARFILSDIHVKPFPDYPPINVTYAHISAENGVITAKEITGRFGSIQLPQAQIWLTNIGENLTVNAQMAGKLKFEKSGSGEVPELLSKVGLKSITGAGYIDFNFNYKLGKSHPIETLLKLQFDGLSSELLSRPVRFSDIKGGLLIHYHDGKTDLKFDEFEAVLDKSPIKLHGKVLGIGSDQWRVKTRIYARQIDLSYLADNFTFISDFKPQGNLSADLNLDIQPGDWNKNRLEGLLEANNIELQLAKIGLTVNNTQLSVQLKKGNNHLDISNITVNGESFNIKADGFIFPSPDIHVQLDSDSVNIDSILDPLLVAGKNTDNDEPNHPSSLFKTLKIDLQGSIRKCIYKKIVFENVLIQGAYDNEKINLHGLNITMEDGFASAKGLIDFSTTEKVSYLLFPNIENINLQTVTPLFEGPIPITGRLSLSGDISGAIQSKSKITKLAGQLNIHITDGRMPNIGFLGRLTNSIFSIINIEDIFNGELVENISAMGVPFKSIASDIQIIKGIVTVASLSFLGDSMNAYGFGEINLPKETINMELVLELFRTINKALDYIPLIDETAKAITRTYLSIKGPLKDPSIIPMPVKALNEILQKTLETPGKLFK